MSTRVATLEDLDAIIPEIHRIDFPQLVRLRPAQLASVSQPGVFDLPACGQPVHQRDVLHPRLSCIFQCDFHCKGFTQLHRLAWVQPFAENRRREGDELGTCRRDRCDGFDA